MRMEMRRLWRLGGQRGRSEGEVRSVHGKTSMLDDKVGS